MQNAVLQYIRETVEEARKAPNKPKRLPFLPTQQNEEEMNELKHILKPLSDSTNALQADGVMSSLIFYNIVSCFDGTLQDVPIFT